MFNKIINSKNPFPHTWHVNTMAKTILKNPRYNTLTVWTLTLLFSYNGLFQHCSKEVKYTDPSTSLSRDMALVTRWASISLSESRGSWTHKASHKRLCNSVHRLITMTIHKYMYIYYRLIVHWSWIKSSFHAKCISLECKRVPLPKSEDHQFTCDV